MNNPFSAFLQPPSQSSPLAGLPEFSLAISERQRQAGLDKQRALENSQQNALAQRGANRADAELALQQGEQSHRFTAEEQKQVEGLLAEYQDAEDQGDQVRLSRAEQMLKRFGMDVSRGKPKPDLQALTGQKPPPLPGKLLPDVQAFTGQKPATPQEAPDLSQADFESQLINNPLPEPSRYEQIDPKTGKPGTTAEYKAMISPDEPENLGDVDDPAFKADAAKEGGVIDLDKEDPTPLQVGQLPKVATQQAPQAAASQSPPRLASQLLPTIVSKGGKQLYESTGPSGRWGPMVAGVLEPFTQHDNPEIGAAAKRAQAMAAKLIEVDGVAPKDAIKLGMDYLNGEANRISQTERTKIGSHRLGGGSGATPGKFQALGPKEDRAESIKGYITESRGAVGKLNESDRLLAQAEALANSPDPALQRNAVDVLVQSRSGATVSERERARYDQLDGAITGISNYISRLGGGAVDPQYMKKIKMVIAEQRRINAVTREEVAADLEEAYAAQNEGKVEQPILERRRKALGKTIRRDNSGAGGPDPNADLDQ